MSFPSLQAAFSCLTNASLTSFGVLNVPINASRVRSVLPFTSSQPRWEEGITKKKNKSPLYCEWVFARKRQGRDFACTLRLLCIFPPDRIGYSRVTVRDYIHSTRCEGGDLAQSVFHGSVCLKEHSTKRNHCLAFFPFALFTLLVSGMQETQHHRHR